MAVALGVAAYVGVEYGAGSALVPATCRWCGDTSLERDLRDTLRWDHVDRADLASDVTGRGLAPALAIGAGLLAGHGGDPGRWFDVGAPIAEAWLATSIVTQAIKLAAARRRPYALHDAPAVEPLSEDNQSFVSGHTSTAAALVTSAGAVLRQRGHRGAATATWIAGGVVVAATGYFRIAADAHHAGDVLAGAVLGAGLGLLVPWLGARDEATARLVVRTDGVALAGMF